MWDPQRLTTLWAFTACYRDSFTLLFTLYSKSVTYMLIRSEIFSSTSLTKLKYDIYFFDTYIHFNGELKHIYNKIRAPRQLSRYSNGLWTVEFIFPTGARDFSVLHRAKTGSGAHPASHPIGTGGFSFYGGKTAGTWNWPLTSISWRRQEWWSYTSTPPNVFMVSCLIG
jgi:hypothetical protein